MAIEPGQVYQSSKQIVVSPHDTVHDVVISAGYAVTAAFGDLPMISSPGTYVFKVSCERVNEDG